MDTDFLGDGILDEEHSLRPGTGGVDPAAFNLADAVILGNIDDDSQSFETSDSGFHMKANLNARLYVSGRSQALMAPDAVPAIASPVTDGVKLTPFEKHVLAFIDGKRPVEVIRRAAGLDEAEVKTALATLADKGVVKVVGRALADFDPAIETAVKRAPQRQRMRGSVVGAVALVGDEADRAIEEAFRTSVSVIAPMLGKNVGSDGAATGDVFSTGLKMRDSDLPSDIDQFVGIKGTDEIQKKPRTEPTSSTLRPSVAKAAVNRGTRAGERNPLQDSQEGIDASAEASAVEKSIVDKSDGFDDFGQPSDVSTAVRAQEFSESSSPGVPSQVEGSRAAARPPSGVFADLSDLGGDVPSLQGLADSRVQVRPKIVAQLANNPAAQRAAMASEMPSSSAELLPSASSSSSSRKDNGAKIVDAKLADAKLADAKIVDAKLADAKLADAKLSEVKARDVRVGGAKAKVAGAKATIDGKELDETPSVEIERNAASGEVWDDVPRTAGMPASTPKSTQAQRGPKRGPGAAGPSPPVGGGASPGGVLPAQAARAAAKVGAPLREPTNPKGSVSTSLSDLLSDNESEQTANVPPEQARAMLARKDAQRDAGASDDDSDGEEESFEEPTAAGQPMLPPGARPKPAPRETTGSRRVVRPSAMVSVPDGERAPSEDKIDESSGLHEVDAKRARNALKGNAGAAEEIFAEDELDFEQPITGPQDRNDDSDQSTGAPHSAMPSMASVSDSSVQSIEPSEAIERIQPKRGGHGDETMPPSQEPSDPEASELDAREDDDPDASVLDDSGGSSVELVDSALVLRPGQPRAAAKVPPGIRPAAKAVPLETAARAARSSKPRERPDAARADRDRSQERSAEASDDSSDAAQGRFADALSRELSEEVEKDSEETLNLDQEEQQRRLGRVVGGSPGAAAGGAAAAKGPVPRASSQKAAAAPPERAATMMVRGEGGGAAPIPSGFSQALDVQPRAKPTDENRRKAAKLFDEALKDAAAGKMSAARMNVKLATIYDQANETYRAQMEAWESAAANANRPATQQRPHVATAPVSSQNSRPSDESQAEIKALYDEAQRFEDSGDVDAALDILEQGVERFPNAAAFHNRIGVILALRKRDYEGAVHAIQRAIDIDPDNLHYKSNLGKIVAKMRGPRPEA